MSTAPQGPKVREFDSGRTAVVTLPTESRATISSNRVEIRRLGAPFDTVAELYRAQVPDYAEAMTEEETRREIVYTVTFKSAQVDTWTEHYVVDFEDSDERP